MHKKTTIRIASLNINGFGNLIRDDPDNKWGKVYSMMAEDHIGILLVQEAHLTEDRVEALHNMYARKLKIFHSSHPEQPTQKGGVAVVLNTRFVTPVGAEAKVVVEGRALQVGIRCQGGDTIQVLCVYAPTGSNGVQARISVFEEIRDFYLDNPNLPRPHLMAGDFNNVEDAIDRLPIGEEPDASIEALDAVKLSLGLMLTDGWRATNPTLRDHTFCRGTGDNAVHSRLDRIYIKQDLFETARDWASYVPSVKTDHNLISVQLVTLNAPTVGPGRPVFPLHLLKDKTLAKLMKQRGLEAANQLEHLRMEGVCRTEDENPQTILHKLKTDWMRIARRHEREKIPKMLAEILKLEATLKAVKADPNMSDNTKKAEAAKLSHRIQELKLKRRKQLQQTSRARHRLEGERPTKYWTSLHRERAPRDLIHAFEREGQHTPGGEKVYETRSEKMADMARTHHIDVQRDEPGMRAPERRERDIQTALDSIRSTVSAEQAAMLGTTIGREDCESALRFSKNGTSPGIDGIQFEVWKTLDTRFIEDSRYNNRQTLNVLAILQAAFEDIQTYGVCENVPFAEGWISPIYKEKGERTKVANYRPITVLNTDYKLLTKVLAVRL
ncbi:hypothetical protein V8D89_002969, partial [Ganoderma adspersum]